MVVPSSSSLLFPLYTERSHQLVQDEVERSLVAREHEIVHVFPRLAVI